MDYDVRIISSMEKVLPLGGMQNSRLVKRIRFPWAKGFFSGSLLLSWGLLFESDVKAGVPKSLCSRKGRRRFPGESYNPKGGLCAGIHAT